MAKQEWIVEGMTCSNCALSVRKVLEKKGMSDVSVNPISGKVIFDSKKEIPFKQIKQEIEGLGYRVKSDTNASSAHEHDHSSMSRDTKLFLFTLPFTLLLLLHMFHQWLPVHWIMNPQVQFFLCLPVFAAGWFAFGKGAWHSLRSGIPNMNVLVLLGASAAFIYSMVGWLHYDNMQYIYFESAASIISLVFLGNYLEHVTMHSTGKALRALTKTQVVQANMIAFNEAHEEQYFSVDASTLKSGDLILIKTGEQVPADCKILSGDVSVDESLLTGESMPVTKTKKDILIGGSILVDGSAKAQVTASGKDAVLSSIVHMVEQAQLHKPPVQQLADRISAVFVPAVIVIALISFFINYYAFDNKLDVSIMRAVAVLVISCPCAMGLATPAAISVGLGRGARNGIIYRNAAVLESFRHIKQVVFDKTGTLTTGKFRVSKFESNINEDEFKSIVYSLETHSAHPIAKSLCDEWKTDKVIRWKKVEEIKGIGMIATDTEGNEYKLGNGAMIANKETNEHDIYLYKNNQCLGWIDIMDDIRPEVPEVIQWLKQKGMEPIMLTGDTERKARAVANAVGIDQIYFKQTPAEKLVRIETLSKQHPTAMIGDGINDAPALAKATIGISMAEASQLAVQSADVIMLLGQLKKLPEVIGLGAHTYLTVKQNLAWAFAYNIIAIPVAAMGFLSPTFSALSMGMSDVMLAFISLYLFIKKVV